MSNIVKLTLEDVITRAKQTLQVVNDDGIVVATAGPHFYSSDKTVVAIELMPKSPDEIAAETKALKVEVAEEVAEEVTEEVAVDAVEGDAGSEGTKTEAVSEAAG